MKTKLDLLLDWVSPEKTIERTYNRASEAINTFQWDKAKVDSRCEFKHCMGSFLKHFNCIILKIPKSVDISIVDSWRFCIHPLMRIYGDNGDIVACQLALTGNEGGLYGVLKAFAMYKAEEYSNNEIFAKVLGYYESLSPEEVLKASEEYMAKYGHLLPSEMTENGAPRIRGYFWKVLKMHPKLIQKIRQTGR